MMTNSALLLPLWVSVRALSAMENGVYSEVNVEAVVDTESSHANSESSIQNSR